MSTRIYSLSDFDAMSDFYIRAESCVSVSDYDELLAFLRDSWRMAYTTWHRSEIERQAAFCKQEQAALANPHVPHQGECVPHYGDVLHGSECRCNDMF